MTIEQAIKTLDAVIPPHTHMTVDREHMPIVLAWETVKEVLKRQRWIPVAERLPETAGVYLVCTGKGSVTKVNFYPELGRFQYIFTHWMPWPEAPEKGGNGNAAD